MSMRPSTQEALTRMQRDRERATTIAAEELARHVDAEVEASMQWDMEPVGRVGTLTGRLSGFLGAPNTSATRDAIARTTQELASSIDAEALSALAGRLSAGTSAGYPDPSSFIGRMSSGVVGTTPGDNTGVTIPMEDAFAGRRIRPRDRHNTPEQGYGYPNLNMCQEIPSPHNITIPINPVLTMDTATSKLMQLISDSLVEGTTIEYNDAVSDILEIIEGFRNTQIETPKPERSHYEDTLRGICSRHITEAVKKVLYGYRYAPDVSDAELLPMLSSVLATTLKAMVSPDTELVSVTVAQEPASLGRKIDVGFKINKEDTLVHTQRIIINDINSIN